MDAIEAGYSTPPNREDSEQVADSDQSEPDEQGEKGGEDEGGEDECDSVKRVKKNVISALFQFFIDISAWFWLFIDISALFQLFIDIAA